MDLREYDYITRRPDTFPQCTLKSIEQILAVIGFESEKLIRKVLENGYINPPPGYKWHGVYRIILDKNEKAQVLDDLVAAKNALEKESSLSEKEQSYLSQYIEYWSRSIHEEPMTYEQYQADQVYYDLRNISEREFIDFLFEHEVEDSDSWYCAFNIWLDYEKPYVTGLYINLFLSSKKLLELYTKDKLEQGFWAIMGPNLEGNVYDLLNDSGLDIELKEKLIHSMYSLYKDLFSLDPLETSSNMWWDSLAYDFYAGGRRNPDTNTEDMRIQNAMFDTLKRILELESIDCQMAALHGLGHLRHKDTREVVENYIRKNLGLSKDQVEYAVACIDGEIM